MGKRELGASMFVVGLGTGGLLVSMLLYTELLAGKKAIPIIKECELHIPRNQNCELKAEPIREID